MISGHAANTIFFNKKKDWASRILAIPNPLSPVLSHFPLILPPPPPVDVIYGYYPY